MVPFVVFGFWYQWSQLWSISAAGLPFSNTSPVCGS
jgi:hypothetical protein